MNGLTMSSTPGGILSTSSNIKMFCLQRVTLPDIQSRSCICRTTLMLRVASREGRESLPCIAPSWRGQGSEVWLSGGGQTCWPAPACRDSQPRTETRSSSRCQSSRGRREREVYWDWGCCDGPVLPSLPALWLGVGPPGGSPAGWPGGRS